MSQTYVACLTPPGSGAIATIAVRGPEAWAIIRNHFRSAKPLPDQPSTYTSWFGTFGEGVGDEVILAVLAAEPETSIEIHCHGGRQVVRWLIDLLVREGCLETSCDELLTVHGAWKLLPHAKTLRTAAILLDQANGAFDRALVEIGRAIESGSTADALVRLHALSRYAPVGQHLIEPWRVVIAGAPNAGKSSLLNALAGYQRSVVAPVPGTTRDVVSAALAFDGWPVELSDTAGLREGRDELEREGIARAQRQLATADLCLWVIDVTDPEPTIFECIPINALPILNKCDRPSAIDETRFPDAIRVSALTGEGIDQLIDTMMARLVPDVPRPGAAVPYSPESCAFVQISIDMVSAKITSR